MNKIRLIPTLIIKFILNVFYKVFCIVKKVDESKITFASYRSPDLTDNLLYIYREVHMSYPEYRKKILVRKFDSRVLGKVLYTFHMIEACYHLATSRYFIIDDYYIPLYMIKRRKGVEVIQLWHCSGALKKFGRSTIGKPFGPSEQYLKHVNVHGNYSKAYVSCTSVKPYFAEAFNMPEENIYPYGNPRTDFLFETEKHAEILAEFQQGNPHLKDKKIILYAPTFRGKSHHQTKFAIPFDLREMKNELYDDYVLFIQLHPYMQENLHISPELLDFAIVNTGEYTTSELFILSDILITDYSTVFFDYSLLNKRMIFYAYDLQQYIEERDFYYDYESLVPGPLVTETKGLINVIKKDTFDSKKISEFRDRFFDHQDGKAAKRIVNNIIKDKLY